MTSSTPVPMSDVEVPIGRQMSNRKSFRNSSMRRGDSFTRTDSVPTDASIIRRTDDEEDEGNSSLRLSAALAAEREETRIRLSKELEGEDSAPEDSDEGGDESGGPGQGEAMTMSLMDLLEETDRQAGIEGPTYRFDDEEEEEVEEYEEEEEVEEEKEEVKGGVGEAACCLCMVKHKGGGLVACGHTFCRMCSREMWVQKGHCPVCSNFASEILDIF